MTIYVPMRFREWAGAFEPAAGSIAAHLPVKFDYGTSCGEFSAAFPELVEG